MNNNNRSKARKQHWIDRAVATHNFHTEQVRLDSLWRFDDTANELNRSQGSISEDILIADWLETHEKKIRSFRQRIDCLEWIREMKKESKKRLVE